MPRFEPSTVPTQQWRSVNFVRDILDNVPFFILYNDQQMNNYFTNYHTATCLNTIVSSSGSLQSMPCQVTQVYQMQSLVIQFKFISHMFYAVGIAVFKIFKILMTR